MSCRDQTAPLGAVISETPSLSASERSDWRCRKRSRRLCTRGSVRESDGEYNPIRIHSPGPESSPVGGDGVVEIPHETGCLRYEGFRKSDFINKAMRQRKSCYRPSSLVDVTKRGGLSVAALAVPRCGPQHQPAWTGRSCRRPGSDAQPLPRGPGRYGPRWWPWGSPAARSRG